MLPACGTLTGFGTTPRPASASSSAWRPPRVILGHRSPVVTEIYAEMDREKAIEAMLEVG